MNCPRTTTGEHEFRKFEIEVGIFKEDVTRCLACGIIDNRKKEVSE